MTEHGFPPNDEPTRACVYCGTTYQLHSAKPQPCVPHGDNAEKLRPEPKRRSLACEDSDTITTRVAELRKAKDEARNYKADE